MTCPSETRLQAFVDGQAAREEITELARHLDGCEDCRLLVAAIQPIALDDETVADRIGRYVLRRVVGKGGMGVVYEAVDPELHRVVAIKVLRADLGALQKRLLAEAEAMAMLSHPNVVRIYDVGRAGERVFIVMELVDGSSLRHWLAREPRSQRAILDAFLQAGHGLRAAHDAGLVHRDFKPENVFVARDGRVLVGDFGLAASLAANVAAGEGSVAYMAPEQRSGEKVDARSDEFSFAVSLQESLPAPVPGWLAKPLARAKMERPEQRYPSMAALLDALETGRRRARIRRRGLVSALVAAIPVGAAAFWATGHTTLDLELCRNGDATIDATWNPAVAKRTEAAFRGTNSPLWEAAWRRTEASLWQYRNDWHLARQRTCEVPRLRPQASAAPAEQRVSCLSERLEMFRAVSTNLERVDAPMLEQVPGLLDLLPRIATCDNAQEVAQLAPPPAADVRAAVDAAKRKIAVAAASVTAGHYQEGVTLADDAWQSAKGTGYLPALAEAYLWRGTAHGRLGHTRESEQALEQAVSSASAGHAPAIAIRAWIQLMHFVGFEAKRYDDGLRYSDYAKAALETMRGVPELEAERLAWARAMLLDQKRFDDALVVSRQELALVELRFGPTHHLAAVALDGHAGVLAGKCKARDAIEPQEKSCKLLEQELGATHPQLALCLSNLAALHSNLGEHDRAIALKERALAMFERVPGHPNHVAMARRNLVRSLLELGRLDAAKTELDTAAALSTRESDETSILLLRAELHRREGKSADALAADEQALARTKDAAKARQLDPLLSAAESSIAAGRYAEADARAERAMQIASDTYGSDSCRTAEPSRLRAEALAGLGRFQAAAPLVHHALDALRDAQVDPGLRARTQRLASRIDHGE